jgi:hypothetical protein
MYALLQSGHVSLYTPDEAYLSSSVCSRFARWISKEFLVRNAIFTLVCLNRLVMYVVFCPVYVKVSQFWFCVGGGFVFFCLCVVFLFVLMGNELLYNMLWIIFSSCIYSSSCSWYVFSLLYRSLTAAYLVVVGG